MELTERLKELSLRLMDMENSDSAAAVEIIKQMDSLKASLQYVRTYTLGITTELGILFRKPSPPFHVCRYFPLGALTFSFINPSFFGSFLTFVPDTTFSLHLRLILSEKWNLPQEGDPFV
jgi:hypothetical protein